MDALVSAKNLSCRIGRYSHADDCHLVNGSVISVNTPGDKEKPPPPVL